MPEVKLSIGGGPAIPLKVERTLPAVCGVTREVLYLGASLQVYRDARDGDACYITENCLQRADAKIVSYVLDVDGLPHPVTNHPRLRRLTIAVHGIYALKDPGLIAANSIQWGPEWNALKTFSMETGDLKPLVLGTTRDTGGAPRHGARVAWGRNSPIAWAMGYGYAALPITLRDPQTLELARDTKIRLGFNPQGVLGDMTGYGMKLDTAHSWSALEPWLATKGTVLERFYWELVEALAVYCVMSDVPGDLTKSEVRGQGRKLRAVCDYLANSADDLPENIFYGGVVQRAWDYYEARAADILSINAGFADEDSKYIKFWQYAQLAFGLFLAEKVAARESKYLRALLDFHCAVGVAPYMLQVRDASGRRFSIDEIKAVEAAKAAADPKTDRYTGYLAEQALFDWIRHEKRLPQLRALDDPAYRAVLGTANGAGFALVPSKRVSWVSLTAGTSFGNLDEAKADVSKQLVASLGNYDGSANWRAAYAIERIED